MQGAPKLKRYLLILRKIESGTYPSFLALQDYLTRHDFENIPLRTFMRDLEILRNEYQVEVLFDRAKKGYYINKERSGERFRQLLRFMELSNTADTLQHLYSKEAGAAAFISLDSGMDFKGSEYIEGLLNAIRNKQLVEITHFNYETAIARTYEIEPYHIKEYRNRWYLVGFSRNHQEIRTFGMDRLTAVQTSPVLFEPSTVFAPDNFFKHLIGVSLQKGEAVRVLLSFKPFMANFVLTVPIHHSQELVVKNDSEVIISLFLVPNYELKMQLLSYGSAVTVLEPQTLKQEMQSVLKEAWGKYNIK